MISLEQLQAGLSISLGEEIALNDTALVYIQIDQPAIESMAQGRIRWEEWDKKSSINGVAAQQILTRPDYSGGGIYLIFVDEVLTFLQPHMPGEEGTAPIPQDQLAEVAELHVAEIVRDFVMEAIVVKARFLLGRGSN